MAPASTATSEISDQSIRIAKPATGETLNIASVPGGALEFSFDPATATITRTGNDLVMEVDGGGVVRLADFFVVGDSTLPSLVLPGGESVASADFLSAFDIELETAAGPGAGAGAAGSGVNEYADDAGALVDGIGRLGSLGTDYWAYESEETEIFESLAALDAGDIVLPELPGDDIPVIIPEEPDPVEHEHAAESEEVRGTIEVEQVTTIVMDKEEVTVTVPQQDHDVEVPGFCIIVGGTASYKQAPNGGIICGKDDKQGSEDGKAVEFDEAGKAGQNAATILDAVSDVLKEQNASSNTYDGKDDIQAFIDAYEGNVLYINPPVTLPTGGTFGKDGLTIVFTGDVTVTEENGSQLTLEGTIIVDGDYDRGDNAGQLTVNGSLIVTGDLHNGASVHANGEDVKITVIDVPEHTETIIVNTPTAEVETTETLQEVSIDLSTLLENDGDSEFDQGKQIDQFSLKNAMDKEFFDLDVVDGKLVITPKEGALEALGEDWDHTVEIDYTVKYGDGDTADATLTVKYAEQPAVADEDVFVWTAEDLNIGGGDAIMDFEYGCDKLLFESLACESIDEMLQDGTLALDVEGENALTLTVTQGQGEEQTVTTVNIAFTPESMPDLNAVDQVALLECMIKAETCN